MNRISSSFLFLPVFMLTIATPLTPVFARMKPTFAKLDTSDRTFLQIIHNDKEAESILLKGEGPGYDENGEEIAPIFAADDTKSRALIEEAFTSVGRSMDVETDGNKPQVCEPLLLSRLQVEMDKLGLSSSPKAVREALLVSREKNLLDDVTLLPLLTALPAWGKAGYRESDFNEKDSRGHVNQVQCPTDNYLALASSARNAKGRSMKRRDIRDQIDFIEKIKIEDGELKGTLRFKPFQIAWLRALEATRFDVDAPFTVGTVVEQLSSAKNVSPRANPKEKPTKVMSKKKKKTGGLSNRLSLYATYNAYQINLLSDAWQDFTDNLYPAASAELHIKYKDGRPDKIIPIKGEEQYRMAAKILHESIEEMKLSGAFAGKSPTFDDMIVASVETGYLHAEELDAAMGVDDLWNPNLSGWTKALNIVKKYGSPALVLIPGGVGIWASLAVTLVETLFNKNAQTAADDRGISIF